MRPIVFFAFFLVGFSLFKSPMEKLVDKTLSVRDAVTKDVEKIEMFLSETHEASILDQASPSQNVQDAQKALEDIRWELTVLNGGLCPSQNKTSRCYKATILNIFQSNKYQKNYALVIIGRIKQDLEALHQKVLDLQASLSESENIKFNNPLEKLIIDLRDARKKVTNDIKTVAQFLQLTESVSDDSQIKKAEKSKQEFNHVKSKFDQISQDLDSHLPEGGQQNLLTLSLSGLTEEEIQKTTEDLEEIQEELADIKEDLKNDHFKLTDIWTWLWGFFDSEK